MVGREMLTALVTGYEDDRMSTDSVVDSWVLMLIDVVKKAAFDAYE